MKTGDGGGGGGCDGSGGCGGGGGGDVDNDKNGDGGGGGGDDVDNDKNGGGVVFTNKQYTLQESVKQRWNIDHSCKYGQTTKAISMLTTMDWLAQINLLLQGDN